MPVVSTLAPAWPATASLDLVDALVDVAGRVGVRHVAGNHRQALLGDVHAGQSGG